jgi:hypothetical protein
MWGILLVTVVGVSRHFQQVKTVISYETRRKFGLGLGILLGFAHGSGGGEPKRIRNWRAVSFRALLFRGCAYGLVFGATTWLIGLIIGVGYRLMFGLKNNPPDIMAGFIIGLIAVLSLGLKRESKGITAAGGSNSARTLKNWRTAGAIALVTGLLAGLIVGLAGGLSDGLTYGLGIGVGSRSGPYAV